MFSLFWAVAMPKQDVAVELFYDGGWHDLVADDDVFTRQPITINRGQGDESAALRPARVTMQLANDDDLYRTSNPESPLYGKAGRNTPLRVSVGNSIRGVTEASSWRTGQTRDFRRSPRRGRAWVDLESGGLLQRINQWSQPLRSAFYRYNARLTTSVGYWPLEDKVGSRTLYTPTDGAQTLTVRGIEFESQSRFPASDRMLVLPNAPGPGQFIAGQFAPGSPGSTSGWQFSFCINFGSIGTTGDSFEFAHWSTADGTSYSLNWVDGNDLVITAYDASFTELINESYAVGNAESWDQFQCFLIYASYSAGTTTIGIKWLSEGSEVVTELSADTFSGIPSSLDRWSMSGGGAVKDLTVGHVMGTAGLSEDLVDPARITAFLGHAGELAAVRFGRLMDEEFGSGFYYVSNGWADSYPMGPQPVDTLPNHLREIGATEDGLIFDYISEARLFLLCRVDRYNQTPALTLNPTDLPALPEEVTDDLPVHNIVTASQRDSGEAVARDDTGPLGTQPPPDGAGEYRQTVDVNVDDQTTLPQVANWWLRRGTVDLPRFPQVTVDLNAVPSIVSDVEAVDVGSVIEIVGFRENVIRLIVLGWTEVIGTHSRKITFNCVPDQQFNVGEYDAARYDSASTMLVGAVDPAVTTLKFGTTDPNELWSTTSEPYDVMISGERVTVTSMGAASNNAELLSSAFENLADIAAWGVNADCTLARSGTFAHGGSFSGLMTVTGSPTQSYIRPSAAYCPRVVPGQSYTHSVWVRSVAGLTTVRATIDWLDEDGAYLSTSDSGGALSSGSWVQRSVTATAPAGAAYAQYGPTILSSPSAGTVLYVDDATITAAVVSYQTATVTRSVNGIEKSLAAGEQIHIATPGRWAL